MFDLFSDAAKVAAQMEIISSEYGFALWETLYSLALEVLFAYVIGLMINQFGGLFTGSMNIIGLIFAVAALVAGQVIMKATGRPVWFWAGLVLCVLIFAVLGRGEEYRGRKK